jgi:hypothetical protein
MGLQLPTDTQHVSLETRQYELFGRPLGQGISRRTLLLALISGAIWFGLLAVLGVDPFMRFGAPLYLVPPSLFVINAGRVDDSGRMALMRGWDWLLATRAQRRQVIRNPLMSVARAAEIRQPFRVQVTTEVTPGHADGQSTARPARRRRRGRQRQGVS